MTKTSAVIIPARYESTRLPGKPLILINGIPMIMRTYNQVRKAVDPKNIYVATDDDRIKYLCDKNKINCLMTSKSCLTGTDRVYEASKQLHHDYFINVQGDEPILNPNDISALIKYCNKEDFYAVNGYTKIKNEEDYHSISIPKLVIDENENLMYMSRSPIPGSNKKEMITAYRQICIYSFSKQALTDFSSRKEKCYFEKIEDIELLRLLEMGKKVKMILMSDQSVSIDNPEDVFKVERIISGNNSFI
jgi:3-deoxy-manno-octulosonate cytidylyltransferase (CMP-KDO synthetase)